jgi:Protein of unknown function (DUF1631)
MKDTGAIPPNEISESNNTGDLIARLLERSARQLTLATGYSLPLVEKDLESQADKAQSSDLRQALASAAAMLRIERSSRALGVADALKQARLRVAPQPLSEVFGANEQELNIAATEISKKVVEDLDAFEQASGLSYEAYRDRCSHVFQAHINGAAKANEDKAGGASVGELDINPIGSLAFSRAACSVFKGLTSGVAANAILRQILIERLTPAVVDVVTQCHHEMVRAKVLPNWQSRGPQNEASSDRASIKTEAFDRATEVNKLAANSGEHLGQAALADIPNPKENMAWLPTLQPVVDIERDAVAFAHSVGVMPYSRESRRYYFGNARKRLASSGLPKGQLAAVDVVSALFDYVVDDKRLPESAKPLFWRLQQPSIALTLLDSSYLADEPRSLRRLIENFGAIVTAFPDDVSRGSELFRRLETVVRAVEIVASSLQTRSAVMSRQVDLEFGKAANSITQLIDRVVRERQALEQTPDRRNRRDFGRRPTRAQEQSVTDKLQKLIDERIGQHDVPDSAREFITQVWMRHLRTAVLRDGEDSQQYKVSLQVVDDLLWSLDNTKRSKTKLASKIPPLIRLLTQGMREIGAKDDEYKPFFDEIFLMHLRKMQSTSKGATTQAYDTGIDSGTVIQDTYAKPVDTFAPMNSAVLKSEQTLDQNVPDEIAKSSVKLPPELLRQAGILPQSSSEGFKSKRVIQRAPLSVDPPPVPTLHETIAKAVEPIVPPLSVTSVVPSAAVAPVDPIEPSVTPELAAGDPLKLLDVLNGLDLTDFDAKFTRLVVQGQELSNLLVVGRWIEMLGRDNSAHYAKIAWVNHRRSVVLLVRSPDRKAQSLRMTEIEQRTQDKRFFILG